MKKLMIAMAVAVMAIAVQAATVTWSLTNVYGTDGTALADSSYSAYLFTTAAADTSTWATSLADLSKGYALTQAGAGKWSDTTMTEVSAINSGSSLNLQAGQAYDFYAIVVNGSKYYVTQTKNVTIPDSASNVLIGFASQKNYTMAGGSSYVGYAESAPEPTSGLLLLLGVAGLALKRKRA